MTLREIIIKQLASIVEEYSPVPFPNDVSDDALFDDFWLDSVAYVSLTSRLETELGIVPEEIVSGVAFPETVGEFVELYERASKPV